MNPESNRSLCVA